MRKREGECMCYNEGDRERGSHRVFCQFFAFYFIFVGWCRQSKAKQSKRNIASVAIRASSHKSHRSDIFSVVAEFPKNWSITEKNRLTKDKKTNVRKEEDSFSFHKKSFFSFGVWLCLSTTTTTASKKWQNKSTPFVHSLVSVVALFMVGVVLTRPRSVRRQQQQQQINAASIRRKKKKSLDKIKTVKCFDFSCSSRRKKGQITA